MCNLSHLTQLCKNMIESKEYTHMSRFIWFRLVHSEKVLDSTVIIPFDYESTGIPFSEFFFRTTSPVVALDIIINLYAKHFCVVSRNNRGHAYHMSLLWLLPKQLLL